ncbi:GNAT family N-acetyltransferase [Kribbella sp. ALI-6-A]|uniref:GNAT family N-acetyltransferase n=1 Tax=Kribbella sp. ALI-6-A TaxID=1933817 RepID=UPI00143CC5EB|nr:GNAT family N-acetyltransferase [Kribbella sp. ALI-6-A]
MIGFSDATVTEVAERIVEPGFDRRTDGFLVFGGEGRPVGYGTAFGKGDRQVVGIQVWSRTPAVAAWLYERTMDRAREMGRQNGHAEITVETDIYRADEPQRGLLAGHAFTNGTTYHRMRIDHGEPVARPAPPAGVVVRRGAWDDASRWTAHELIIECFQGQYGFVVRPHEEWVEYLELSSTFDWSQMTMLEVDGRAVALRICTDEHLENDDCGCVGMLCVLEEFRGRGLARFLLQDAFAHDSAAGRAGTMLDVDTNNPTPALGLYLAVGMRPILVSDGWRRVLSVN